MPITITYKLSCPCSSETALCRLGELFLKEGVSYQVGPSFLRSTRTPVVMSGLQRIGYSRYNRVGLNPFAYITAIEAHLEPVDQSHSTLTLHVNRRRALLYAVCGAALSLPAGIAMPTLLGAMAVIVTITSLASLGTVTFFAGYLVRKEIQNYLAR